MNPARTADLLEANEHLVLAVLRAQEEAAQAAAALRDLHRMLRVEAAAAPDDAGLPFHRLAHGLAVARRSGSRLGLLVVSLGSIEELNDAMGHAFGEQVLGLAARRLAVAVRDSDLVSRLGDHEFLVQLTALSQPADAMAVADSVLAAMALPLHLDGREIRLKVTIGASVYPDDGDDADALVDRATAAMYHARREGLGSYVFQGEAGTNARSLELRQHEAQQQGGSRADDVAAVSPDVKVEVNQQLVLAALRAQELLAAAQLVQREQSAFMGVVAHELRGPLGPLSNAAALLGRAKASGLVMRMVQRIIDRQVAHLGRLVSDLLDVTRFHTGKLRLDVQRLDLREVLADCCEAAAPAMAARAQHLSVSLPEGEIPVHGDRVRLTQVFGNLLDNAAKYTQPGGHVALAVQLSADEVAVSVSDDGIGIAPEALPHVFVRYVQERRATSFDPSGLGIGLALVHDLVAAHDGRVVASSAGPGRGSCFSVTLPLRITRH